MVALDASLCESAEPIGLADGLQTRPSRVGLHAQPAFDGRGLGGLTRVPHVGVSYVPKAIESLVQFTNEAGISNDNQRCERPDQNFDNPQSGSKELSAEGSSVEITICPNTNTSDRQASVDT